MCSFANRSLLGLKIAAQHPKNVDDILGLCFDANGAYKNSQMPTGWVLATLTSFDFCGSSNRQGTAAAAKGPRSLILTSDKTIVSGVIWCHSGFPNPNHRVLTCFNVWLQCFNESPARSSSSSNSSNFPTKKVDCASASEKCTSHPLLCRPTI